MSPGKLYTLYFNSKAAQQHSIVNEREDEGSHVLASGRQRLRALARSLRFVR
jgi:hypothetical protein